MGNACACNDDLTDASEMITEEDRKNIQYVEKVYENGARYIGQMDTKRNVRHGQGKFVYENNQAVYEGQWGQDKGQGKGKFQDSVSEYIGQWDQGHKHGYGEERWFADNTIYRGLFRNGKKHGQGKYSWGDGSSYEGQFLEDEISGKGSFKDSEGEYTGQFIDSSNHGQGVYKASDGSVYDGQWDSGEKHGHGTLIWPDGRRYVGQWYADSQHGRGEFLKKEGTSSQVFFVNGKKSSQDEMERQIGKDWSNGGTTNGGNNGANNGIITNGIITNGTSATNGTSNNYGAPSAPSNCRDDRSRGGDSRDRQEGRDDRRKKVGLTTDIQMGGTESTSPGDRRYRQDEDPRGGDRGDRGSRYDDRSDRGRPEGDRGRTSSSRY